MLGPACDTTQIPLASPPSLARPGDKRGVTLVMWEYCGPRVNAGTVPVSRALLKLTKFNARQIFMSLQGLTCQSE